MKYTESAGQPVPCPACGAEVPPTLLVCPACNGLMRTAELKALAAEARTAHEQEDWTTEIGAWRSALELLPPGSQQHTKILEKVTELSKLLDSGKAGKPKAAMPPPPPPASGAPALNATSGLQIPTPPMAPPGLTPTHKKLSTQSKSGILAGLAIAATFLLKSKFALVFLLTKGKLLLLGLTQASTFFSMFLSFGLYMSLWGWKFAAGLVVGIYIHEMGHVAALRRLGIKATAPMFIPGLGALIRLKQYPADAREDARIGLAGPLWGLGASLGALAVYGMTGSPIWAAIARINAYINLFNLLPVASLDGAHGFRALAKWQRWTVAGAFGAAYAATIDWLLVLLAVVAVWAAFTKKEEGPADTRAFVEFLLLITALSALLLVKVPGIR